MQLDGPIIDTLTVSFWRDRPGDEYRGIEPPGWCCRIGPDPVVGCMGAGATPLEALRDLCEQVAKDEGKRTDHGLLLLR
jgi:hypothetical protein